MFLKINCFKALIKKAWSGVGLTVGNDGTGIYLLGGYWSIYLDSVWMTKKAKAAIIELTGFIPAAGQAVTFWKSEDNQTDTGFIPAAGQAVTFWKSEDNQTEERELLPERYYKPDTCYFKTKYKDTGIRIRDYGRGVAVLQNTNTMETEERELLPERYYKPDTCYFKTKYKDTGIRIRDYGRGVAVLQNTNTMGNILF